MGRNVTFLSALFQTAFYSVGATCHENNLDCCSFHPCHHFFIDSCTEGLLCLPGGDVNYTCPTTAAVQSLWLAGRRPEGAAKRWVMIRRCCRNYCCPSLPQQQRAKWPCVVYVHAFFFFSFPWFMALSSMRSWEKKKKMKKVERTRTITSLEPSFLFWWVTRETGWAVVAWVTYKLLRSSYSFS